ncbi:MAG TPA: inositol monophosphatase family protein, partial [Nitrososphaera sp.]|nr:inositol monophosphatase family protein [Nitrososphaera sp.]
MDPKDVLAHSLEAGRQAAGILLENFGKTHEVSIKSDNSYVTNVDRESQALIINYLGNQFPDIPFIAEEQERRTNESIGGGGHY